MQNLSRRPEGMVFATFWLCLVGSLSSAIFTTSAKETQIPIAPHQFDNVVRELPNTMLKQPNVLMPDPEPTSAVSFVQKAKGDRELWVGVLDHEFVMQSSQAMVLAFKSASKFIYSGIFLQQLFRTNPWLKYLAVTYEKRIALIKSLNKIAEGSSIRYRNKSKAAVDFMAKHFLKTLFPIRQRLIGANRAAYKKHLKSLSDALYEAKAGSHALDMVLANNTMPLYSWTHSLWQNPFSTVKNVLDVAFDEAVGGLSGLWSTEVRGSCFSFAYRVNTVAPYTAVFPGGILGDIMKGLVRSYLLVFHHAFVSFKGIFAFLIAIICKTGIVQAAINALKPLYSLLKRGRRGLQALKSKTFAMRGDPIGRGFMDRFLYREAVVLITILFQMHAVDIEEHRKKATRIEGALLAGTGAWALSEGLFVGASEFGRAFKNLVHDYTKSATAYVEACEKLKAEVEVDTLRDSDKSQSFDEGNKRVSAGASDRRPVSPELLEDALKYLEEANRDPSSEEATLTYTEKLLILNKSCNKNSKFLSSFPSSQLQFTQRLIAQMVRVLRFSYRYFKTYIADILSIFYETAKAMLEADVANVVESGVPQSSPGEAIAVAQSNAAVRRATAQSNLDDSSLPRKIFRRPRFAKESEKLAYGFFESVGGFALFEQLEILHPTSHGDLYKFRRAAADYLTRGEAFLRSGLGKIYSSFLNSQIILSRLQNDKPRMTIMEFISKCRTPLEEKTEKEERLCGKIVTTDLDSDEFITNALYSMNLAVSGSSRDLAFNDTSNVNAAFENWALNSNKGRRGNAQLIIERLMDSGSLHLHKSWLSINKHRTAIYGEICRGWRVHVDSGKMASLVNHLRGAVTDKDRSSVLFASLSAFSLTLAGMKYPRTRSESSCLTVPAAALRLPTTQKSDCVAASELNDIKRIVQPKNGSEETAEPIPDPLDCMSRFTLIEQNEGYLEFFMAAGQRQTTNSEQVPQELTPQSVKSAIRIRGTIVYNDERKELRSIQTDPQAINDVLVSHFMDKKGRVGAEVLARILNLMHRKNPIFWKHSPVDFLQNMTAKMFFDTLHIVSTQAYNKSDASIQLDGKLYSFPKTFAALKDIVLSAVNRAILRMHSLNASDAISIIAMSTANFAYRKIQKHRTGRTAVMHLFLKEVAHIMKLYKENHAILGEKYTECAAVSNLVHPTEEDVVKCAFLRFITIGSLDLSEEKRMEARLYVETFVNKLATVKGSYSWSDFLNLNYFLPTMDIYSKTAARYKFELLANQLNGIQGSEEEQSLLDRLIMKLHPALGGPTVPKPKSKKGVMAVLKTIHTYLSTLPSKTKTFMSKFVQTSYAKVRRLVASRRSWFAKWKPTVVIQGPQFIGAVRAAEAATYPDSKMPRQLFIDSQDLLEFGKLLLSIESITATLDNPTAMYNVVTTFRSTPMTTPAVKEQHAALIERAKVLGSDAVRVAAGWVLKGASGVLGAYNMSLGLLGLLDSSGKYTDKVLQLRYLSAEALSFLTSTLDLAYLLIHLPPQKKGDINTLRFSLNAPHEASITVKAQSEPLTLALNSDEKVNVAGIIQRCSTFVEESEEYAVSPERAQSAEEFCSTLFSKVWEGANAEGYSLPHELLAGGEAFGMCYILVLLRKLHNPEKPTTTIEEMFDLISLDGYPLRDHLNILRKTSVSSDQRMSRAKMLAPLMRMLFISLKDGPGQRVGGVSFSSYEPDTKVVTFQYTVEETSPRNGSPSTNLVYAGNLVFGVGRDGQPTPHRFVTFNVEAPHMLMEWYRFVQVSKLRDYVDSLRTSTTECTYKEIANLSTVYKFIDLADFFFSLRQSSKTYPLTVVEAAAKRFILENGEPELKQYGLANSMVDLVQLSEIVKKKCFKKALEEYGAYQGYSELEREMFQFDCYHTEIASGGAMSELTLTLTDEDVQKIILSINSEYTLVAKALYEKVIGSKVDQKDLKNRALDFLKEAPVIDMTRPLVISFFDWIDKRLPWEEVMPQLTTMRDHGWLATKSSPILRRTVSSLEHPMLFNPLQSLISILHKCISGTSTRRRKPVRALIARGKALISRITTPHRARADRYRDIGTRNQLVQAMKRRYIDGESGAAEDQVISDDLNMEQLRQLISARLQESENDENVTDGLGSDAPSTADETGLEEATSDSSSLDEIQKQSEASTKSQDDGFSTATESVGGEEDQFEPQATSATPKHS